jgi:hypothetical protein
MDVKIAYGINIEKVPETVAQLIDDVNVNEIEQTLSIVCRLLRMSSNNSSTAVVLLEEARIKLGAVDRAVSDAHMILKGYSAATEEPKNQTQAQGGDTDAD